MKKHFSIMPLNLSCIDELCEDIKNQVENGICDMPLFCMSLHPEGTPPADKGRILSDKYALFKEKLDKMGIQSGVLVQSSIGHGYTLSEESPFLKYVNLNDGETQTVCCPYDESFHDYIRDCLAKIASKNPDLIMIDDDFRLVFRFGNGCACERHMQEFRKKSGMNITREELFEILKQDAKGEVAKYYLETQKEPLYECAKAMRAGIDSVNKKIPATFCAAGCNVDYAVEIARILAGEGNPVVVRASHGVYVPEGARFISRTFYRVARQISYLKDKVDFVLAECDTIPHNQYALSAHYLHSHFVGAMLEGAVGSKRWITRLRDYEKESGIGYRKILSKHQGFYEKLAELVKDVRYMGAKIPLSNDVDYSFCECGWDSDMDGGEGVGMYMFERIGLPVYYSAEDGGAAFLSGEADRKFTDDEILNLLKGSVFLFYDTAERLIKRGFGEYLGVSVRKWQGELPNIEKIFETGKYQDAQYQTHELVPLSDDVVIDSMTYHTVDKEHYTELFPGTTVYKNKLGGTVVVFAGTPIAPMNYLDGFAFLSYSRKRQLIHLMSDCGALPIYYDGQEEMYFKAGKRPNGEMLLALINIGFDPAEEIVLGTDLTFQQASYLTPEGELKELEIRTEPGKLIIKKDICPLTPVILLLK